jgi:hypothetical protein
MRPRLDEASTASRRHISSHVVLLIIMKQLSGTIEHNQNTRNSITDTGKTYPSLYEKYIHRRASSKQDGLHTRHLPSSHGKTSIPNSPQAVRRINETSIVHHASGFLPTRRKTHTLSNRNLLVLE